MRQYGLSRGQVIEMQAGGSRQDSAVKSSKKALGVMQPSLHTLLVVIEALDVGGTEKHIVQVLPLLARNGFRPLVYTLTRKGRLAPQLEATGIEIIRPPYAETIRHLPRPLRRLILGPLSTVMLLWLLLKEKPDIVHFFLPTAYLVGGFCSLAVKRRTLVMSRRSLNYYQRKHRILTRLEMWLHRRMTAVLGNSEAVVKQLAQEGVPADRLGLVYNGIELDRFNKLPVRSTARAKLNLAATALVMTVVANLIPYKGHADLLEALALIREQLPKAWVLLCVGRDDGVGEALDVLAKGLGIAAHVRWLGERSDLPTILAASDISLLCSHEEGFPNAVLEAMAAGLPTIVTDVGGIGEAVVDGVTGFVVRSQDPHAIGPAILKLAEDEPLRKTMGVTGRARVQKVFPISRCVVEYARLYRGLLHNQGGPISEILKTEYIESM